jgi:hypothetical protein
MLQLTWLAMFHISREMKANWAKGAASCLNPDKPYRMALYVQTDMTVKGVMAATCSSQHTCTHTRTHTHTYTL